MFKGSHRLMIAISGATWLCIGLFLIYMGIHFLGVALHSPLSSFSLLGKLKQLVGKKEEAFCLLITFALFIGYLKGKYILSRSVKRQVKRLVNLPNPLPLKYLYNKGYYFLILGMMTLGMLLRFLPVSVEFRGIVDLAIGAALVQGALMYFRFATTQYHDALENKNL